jgi:hypothetical protein
MTDLARRPALDEIAGEYPMTLAVSRPPEAVLAEAHEAAAALKRVIDAKPKKVVIGDETYLEFEDWQTVGRFYGIAPRVISTTFIELGQVAGWEARAEAVHVESGRVVSSADAMCLNDEEKWGRRAKYEWHYVKKSGGTSAEDPGRDELLWEPGPSGKNRPRKERVRVADEAVPQFQLRSMAQTRAAAKALRNALAWVVVLAGYKPTPAEELEHRELAREPAPAPAAEEPAAAPARAAPAVDADDPTGLLGRITDRWAELGTKASLQVKQWERIIGVGDDAPPFLSPTADRAKLVKLLVENGGTPP